MTRSTSLPHKPTRAPTSPDRRPDTTRKNSIWTWLGLGLPLLAIVVLIAVGSWTFEPQHGLQGREAPDFTLATTSGTQVDLDDLLAGGNDAMLYFSMGVGCDGCFAQIPEIRDALAERGVTLVSVMVDEPGQVAAEGARFGIEDPILIDRDRSVSEAYGMLGVYGHADRPSHSFALVNGTGEITWVRHYAEMFVPENVFLTDAGL